jgi:hypothetical protein
MFETATALLPATPRNREPRCHLLPAYRWLLRAADVGTLLSLIRAHSTACALTPLSDVTTFERTAWSDQRVAGSSVVEVKEALKEAM